ncbi:response regulator [Cohnella herbarum]|uniref:histidine kinase n=1 Tax=Cohnella herbarum TaxID=2728023 RepID=A0A7Z2VGK7_9BACL|nr:response regulator [Cohnella herbarum]QJD82636.1 response regulator [Cohnella herbarum]
MEKALAGGIVIFSILIVDDHKHLVESMMTTIPWEKYRVSQVFGAHSGIEALNILSNQEIHLLITDIQMPVMSGFELIEKVREGWPDIDCILLTGFAEFQYARRAIELQASNYLLKPVRDEELLPLVSDLLNNQRRKMLERSRMEWLEQASEISVLEERRRIAYDLHDILGHTLTNTIVQLEIAERLLETKKEGGLERVKQTQELVRQGLADVRQALSTMKSKDEGLDLEVELERYLSEVKALANVSITSSIELPFTIIDPLCIKIVSLALKEGITNGLRHGKANEFEFDLTFQDERLLFKLWNNGASFDGEKPGLGLTGMRERVKQLGGNMELKASQDERVGSLLTLQIPL